MTNRRGRAPKQKIGQLVSRVYGAAPAGERRQLIEHLLQPLSLLSLFAVANGVFARIWFRRDWQDLHVRVEDLDMIGPSDVTALVDFVQQVSIDTIDGLTQVITTSPAMGASAAAALLIAALIQRRQSRAAGPDRESAQN